MNAKNIAIVGATGAVGVEIVRVPRAAELPAVASLQAAGLGPLGRQDARRSGQASTGRGTDRARASRASTWPSSRPAARISRAVRADRRCGRQRSWSTTPRPSAWTRRAAGGARGQPRRPHAAQGHHRQPQLLDDHHERAGLAAAQGATGSSASSSSTYQAASRRRRRGDGGAGGADPRLASTARPITTTVLPAPDRLQRLQPQHARSTENGYNEEETKMVNETRKIFGDADDPR